MPCNIGVSGRFDWATQISLLQKTLSVFRGLFLVKAQIVKVQAFVRFVGHSNVVPAVLLALDDVNLEGLFHGVVGLYNKKGRANSATLMSRDDRI